MKHQLAWVYLSTEHVHSNNNASDISNIYPRPWTAFLKRSLSHSATFDLEHYLAKTLELVNSLGPPAKQD